MSEGEPGERISIDEARDRLRARGYLDRGVEGAVLKGALAARSRALVLLQGAAVGALFLAAALAAVETALVASGADLSARDIAVLFGWVFAGALLAAALVVALLVGVAWLRTRGRGDADGAMTELATGFGILAGLGGALAARQALEASGPAGAAAVLASVAIAVVIAFRVARGVALAVLLASGRAVLRQRRRAGLATLALVAVGVAVLAVVALRRPPPSLDEPLVVRANTHRVVVVGVDGWSDRYLDRDAAVSDGRATHAYRKADLDPAAFWTTVATGEPASRHGIGSLDLVRVRGVSDPVRASGGTGWIVGKALPALGLARRESVTAAARRVPAAWEVARRGGLASLVVGWWTTYPADERGGTVLGNHLFFAARAGHSLAGEGWPAEAAERAARLAPRLAPEPGTLDRLIEDAEGLDDFSIRAFLDASAREKPRLALLYLPGLDILGSALAAPDRNAADRVALASALTAEARKVEAFLASDALRKDVDLLAVILDGGRREAGGVVRLEGPLARAGTGPVAVEDLAPTLLGALGVPASRQTAGRVRPELLAPDTVTGETVATWGRRRVDRVPPVDPKEYVENLRSLGYLK